MRRLLASLLTFAVATAFAGVAAAHPVPTEDGDAEHVGPHQHGPTEGHLPPVRRNVNLVSKLELTQLEGGIADVGYFKGYAYLNAWAPNCRNEGGPGAGVHVVDIRDPRNPRAVGFLPANENEYPGEGIHVMHVDTPFFTGDLLLHNNEPCSSGPATLGFSMWDVTNPLSPVKIGQFGDADPPVGEQVYHSIHSVQGFTQPGRAFAVLVDNQELKDVDIVDITNPLAPVFASEQGLEDWPGAQGSYANGDSVFHHDVQFKRIGGRDLLAVSYWDAGQVLLDVDDPYNPVFLGDSDYRSPDPETGFAVPEGNSHQAYWSSNNRFLLSTDEDFAPFRTLFEITTGPNAGAYGAGEFGWLPSIDSLPDGRLNGPTIFGGQGCDGDPMPPPASTVPADPGEEKTVVFSRGTCFFSQKVENGQDLGYDAVIIGQSHTGSRNGLLPDSFICGGQGHDFDERARGICIGHRAMHLLFDDAPSYAGPEGLDIPLGQRGHDFEAETVFDGWGYVNLHDATNPNLPIIDTYAVPEALQERFADGFGALTVHEVKTDPRRNVNLAYFSWYAAGFRVAEFGSGGIREVGAFIDQGGNDFWGVFPVGNETAGHGYGSHPGRGEGLRPLVLLSDRDYGLYIVEYTGKRAKADKARDGKGAKGKKGKGRKGKGR